jgi:hypothetical protein
MLKKWAISALAMICLAIVSVPAKPTHAADMKVKVTLPAFRVTLNGHVIDNEYRLYPLLVYKGITYFPMTWNDARLLGLESQWSPETGLVIQQSKVTASYAPDKTTHRNASVQTANIVTSAIKVNGKAIDNAKEPYPLLHFRDVTYFPLTWRFAHDEFGWEYQWDSATGLQIASRNLQLIRANLPVDAARNGVALFKEAYYFVITKGLTNHIYRASVIQPAAAKEIYSYSWFEGSEWNPAQVAFQIRNDELWFVYHEGGGVTGSDVYVKIDQDGNARRVGSGYAMDYRETPYGTLVIDNRATNDSGNLYFKEGADRKIVGDDTLLKFAHSVTAGENGLVYAGSSADYAKDATATTVVGDDVYVLIRNESAGIHQYIYKINLKTNQTERIIGTSVDWFKIANQKLFYVKSQDRALYVSGLDGKNERRYSAQPITWFDVVGNRIFYLASDGLHQVDQADHDILISNLPFAGASVIGNKLLGELQNNQGFVVFDASGSVLVKAAEPIKRVIPSDTVFVQLARDDSIQIIL